MTPSNSPVYIPPWLAYLKGTTLATNTGGNVYEIRMFDAVDVNSARQCPPCGCGGCGSNFAM